tara:strand:- start:5809 stop:5976 length:168 start_codon:yes stop_codon:yes gene_type:complete
MHQNKCIYGVLRGGFVAFTCGIARATNSVQVVLVYVSEPQAASRLSASASEVKPA